MKKILVTLFVLAFIFSFDITALADEDHSNNLKQATEKFINGTTDDQKQSEHEGMDMDSGNEHEDMDMSGGNGQMNHDEGASASSDDSGTEGHHAVVAETPPNYKVLGTFGAVNLLFIIMGVWNKWFRTKGDLNHGNA